MARRYGKVDLGDVLNRHDEIKANMSGDIWKPKVGTNVIRILPPWSEDQTKPFREFGVHWNIGPNEQPVVCLRKEKGVPCFLCEQVEALLESEDPKDQEIGAELRAGNRAYLNILDMNDLDSGVQVMSCGIKMLSEILAYFADPDWGDLTDPEEGYNVTIEREGTGKNKTRYTVRAKKKSSPIPDEGYLDQLKDLDKLVKTISYEKQKALYEGVSDEESSDNEGEEEAPKVSKAKPAGKSGASAATSKKAAAPQAPAKKTGAKKATETEDDLDDDGPPEIGKEVGEAVEKAVAEKPDCFGVQFDPDECEQCRLCDECRAAMKPKRRPV